MIIRNKTSKGAHVAPTPAPTTPRVAVLFQKLALTACVALATTISIPVFAQSNADGYVYGEIADAPAGSKVVAINVDTGLSREVSASGSGAFRISSLPVGNYRVVVRSPDGKDVQTAEYVSVRVGSGSLVRFSDEDAIELATLEIRAAGGYSAIDVTQSDISTNLDAQLIKELPVAQNVTAVALLAPGTVKGDSAFGNLASFGGASVAENAYFVNGFNVTNFRTGVGFSTPPFEFYEDFQVKTGGYGAEFGRSTGGVVNTVTRSGTNEWNGSLALFYEPDFLRAKSPNVVVDGDHTLDNRQDKVETLSMNIGGGGAIVKDKLFFYGIFSQRDVTDEFASMTSQALISDTSSPTFWGGKLDWQITSNHSLELTAFSDTRDIDRDIYAYNQYSQDVGAKQAALLYERGGENIVLRYTGQITPDFSVSALYGRGVSADNSTSGGDDRPWMRDDRVVTAPVQLGNYLSLIEKYEDTREAIRIDAEYRLGNHRLRAGLDLESNETVYDVAAPGPDNVRYRYYLNTSGAQRADVRTYRNQGSVDVDSVAYYVEDSVNVLNDRLLLSVGLRNEAFENKNKDGQAFVKIDQQIAPRLAAVYDLAGDGTSKVFVNWGRYFLPIASNTNLRAAGDELYTQDIYQLLGLNADGTPILGNLLASGYFSSGTLKNPKSVANADLDPMYQDELIVGYQKALSSNISVGISGTYRDMKSTLEDVAVDAALNAYAEERGYDEAYGFYAGGFDYYVVTNPGKDIRIEVDFSDDPYTPGDSDPSSGYEEVLLRAEDLGYVKPGRKYYAVDVFLDYNLPGKFYGRLGYTWSQSYGNSEGYVKSDNGQDDAGLTTSFDQPGLQDGSYGFLPNDRRHQVKAYGIWTLTKEFQLGATFMARSGRPINGFGNHPTDEFAFEYGSESFYVDGVLTPRGSQGRTPWTTSLDVSFKYRPGWAERLTFGLDIFNIYNSQKTTEVDELAEIDFEIGGIRPQWKTPVAFQEPIYVRTSLTYSF